MLHNLKAMATNIIQYKTKGMVKYLGAVRYMPKYVYIYLLKAERM